MVGSAVYKSGACDWEVCDFGDTQRRITYVQAGVNLIHRQRAIAAETRYPIISRESVAMENYYNASQSFFSASRLSFPTSYLPLTPSFSASCLSSF